MKSEQIIILVISMIGLSIFSLNKINSNEIFSDDRIIDISKETIELFYRNNDINEDNELDYVGKKLNYYLFEKAKINHHVSPLNKFNYTIAIKLLDSKPIDNKKILNFQVTTSYSYNATGKATSGYSEEVLILFNNSTNKIDDLFVPLNYYDEGIRGYISDEVSSDYSILIDNLEKTTSLDEKIQDLKIKLGMNDTINTISK